MTLAAAPVPSVAFWNRPKFFRVGITQIVGPMCLATTNSSANFEIDAVRDIGLSNGTISASFHDNGNCCQGSTKLLLGLFPENTPWCMVYYIITLRIQALSFVESHDLLETDARNYITRDVTLRCTRDICKISTFSLSSAARESLFCFSHIMTSSAITEQTTPKSYLYIC